MRTPSQDAELARTTREAWQWVVRLRDGKVDRDALARWLHWCQADARHQAAFDEASAIWQQTSRIEEEAEPLRTSAWHVSRRSLAALAAVLVVAVGVVLATGVMHPAPDDAPAFAPAQITAAPRPETLLVRETQLPDGSRVELAASSTVTMEYTEAVRQLTMQSGVAHFTVAPNPARPFIVRVGKLQVRAVGTAFNIRHASDRVVVTVTEGTVNVYEGPGNSTSAGRSIRVDAGRELTWAAKASGPRITSVDPARSLAWREGRLDYLNEPLASAVADINRYSQRQIVVQDAAVGSILFSGTVLIDQTEDWVRTLPRLFPVDVQTDAQGNIVLTARAS